MVYNNKKLLLSIFWILAGAALLVLTVAEVLKELSENSEEYDGWISRSWIQEEYIHVDTLPARLVLPRRYAFRYLKITMMDTSPKYKLVVRHAECLTESAVESSLIRKGSDSQYQHTQHHIIAVTLIPVIQQRPGHLVQIQIFLKITEQCSGIRQRIMQNIGDLPESVRVIV